MHVFMCWKVVPEDLAQVLNGTDFDAKKSAFGIILTHMPLYHVEGIKFMTN